MRKVTMVVPVLMTSCQVSEKPKIGPVTAQATITATAIMKAQGEPTAPAVTWANLRKNSFIPPAPCYTASIGPPAAHHATQRGKSSRRGATIAPLGAQESGATLLAKRPAARLGRPIGVRPDPRHAHQNHARLPAVDTPGNAESARRIYSL